MKRYRKGVYCPMKDLWYLEERRFLFFWESLSVGSEKAVDAAVERLNEEKEAELMEKPKTPRERL